MSVSFYQHVNKSKNSRAGNELCKKLGTKDYKSGGQKLTLLNYQLRVGKKGIISCVHKSRSFHQHAIFWLFVWTKWVCVVTGGTNSPWLKIDLNLSTNSNSNGKILVVLFAGTNKTFIYNRLVTPLKLQNLQWVISIQ